MQTITGYVTGLSSNMGSVITGGMSLITNLMTGIMQTVPVLLTYIPQILSGVVTTIIENLPMIVQSGMDLISNLASGVWENRLIIWDYISGITGEMSRLVTEIDWAGLGRSVIEWIAGGVQFLFNNLPNLLQEIGTSAWNLLSSIDWLGLGGVVIETIVSGIDALFDAIPDILTSIGEAGKKLFTEIDWLSVGSDIINGIVEGVKGAGEMLWGAIKDVASSALESVKKFLKIGSPSKVFSDQVGHWIPEGTADGVVDNKDVLTKAMEEMAMDAAAVPIEQIITDGRRLSGLQGNTTNNNLGGINITINTAEGATSREIAEEAVDIIINELRRSYA
jgi:phage-related protein